MSRVAIACHRYQHLGFRSHTKARTPTFRLCTAMASGGNLRYKLTDVSTLILEQGDLTKYRGDAIVNAGRRRNKTAVSQIADEHFASLKQISLRCLKS